MGSEKPINKTKSSDKPINKTQIGIAPFIGSILGAWSSANDIKNTNRAILAQSRTLTENMIMQEKQKYEMLDFLDRELGAKMSEVGLEALKAEARLRTAAAETGTSGGTTDMVRRQAIMSQSLSNANLIASNRMHKFNLAQQMISHRSQYRENMASLRSKIPSTASAVLGVLSGAEGGYIKGTKISELARDLVSPNEPDSVYSKIMRIW
jgi:hypothetical protein